MGNDFVVGGIRRVKTNRGLGFVLLAICAGCAVLVMLGIAHVRFWGSTSRLPERGFESLSIEGISGDVTIKIDRYGVPHVEADYETDLWFAQGYLQARERFFQMDLDRRQAAGRLSEIFGEQTLVEDRKMRTLRLGTAILNHHSQLDVDELAALDSFTNGVNAALKSYGRWIAPETWLVGLDPEPWKTEDSIAVALLYQLRLSASMGEELDRSVELARLGRKKAIELWNWTEPEARSWIPPNEQPNVGRYPEDAITPGLAGRGGNNWVIAGSRTKTGLPLLANDHHVGVSVPAAWYAIHLKGAGINVAGASIPGLPGVAIGHTEGVAWGLAPSMMDDQDLYHLTLDEARMREEIDGAWHLLRTITERIEVRWRDEPELLKVRISERGPIIRDSGGSALALTWSLATGPSPLRALLRMATSNTVADLVVAWEGVPGPSFNLVAADVEGHILHHVVGLVPERGRGGGRLVAPGSDSRWAWRGFLPLAANPHVADPEIGFLANANHDIFDEGDYPDDERFSGEFESPWRVRRIRKVLSAREDWDVEACLKLQGDVSSPRAIAILKKLWPDLERHGGPTAQALQQWDAHMDADSVPAHLFSQLMLALTQEISGDEALREGLLESPLGQDAILRLLSGGLEETWWDDLRTGETEGRQEIVDRCLDEIDGLALVTPWGQEHQTAFVHPLERFPVVGPFFGLRASTPQFSMPGDGSTVNATYWSGSNGFEVEAIPALRFVADVGDWDASVMMIAPGQSGRSFSGNYNNQLDDWMHLKMRPLVFSEDAVAEATRSGVRLTPNS